MMLKGPKEAHGNGRFVRARRDCVPAYLRTEVRWKERVEEALSLLTPSCRVCPRECRDADRARDQLGFCRVGRRAQVSSSFAHLGEEDVLRGWKGSGTVFFTQCNLRCVFCQNHDISQSGPGGELAARDLAAVMLRLQEAGCHNINLVTPTHVVPQIVEAVALAVEGGLRLPLVYNSGGYDSMASLELLDGLVDVYMPDFKLWDGQAAARMLRAADYPSRARRALAEMHRQVGDLLVSEDGVASRGVLVRHLVMPGMSRDTEEILKWLAGLSRDTYVNIMDQYSPAGEVRRDKDLSSIGRGVSRGEMDEAGKRALEAGLWRLDRRSSVAGAAPW